MSLSARGTYHRLAMNICVYCASSSAVAHVYFEEIRNLGREIARRGHRIIYGAGAIGLMGALAAAARESGGEVVGVIPAFLNDMGLADPALTSLHVTPDMRSRKQTMEDLADAFIACPGGFGTLEEIFEVITFKQLGRHAKACVLLNTRGYFDPLIAQIDRGIAEHFIKPQYHALFHVAKSPAEALDYIDKYQPRPLGEKWYSEADVQTEVGGG